MMLMNCNSMNFASGKLQDDFIVSRKGAKKQRRKFNFTQKRKDAKPQFKSGEY